LNPVDSVIKLQPMQQQNTSSNRDSVSSDITSSVGKVDSFKLSPEENKSPIKAEKRK
jgi:hypothetical protein